MTTAAIVSFVVAVILLTIAALITLGLKGRSRTSRHFRYLQRHKTQRS